MTLSYIHSGYTRSEQPVQAPNSTTPKRPWMQMQHLSFAHMSEIRAYCQLYYCDLGMKVLGMSKKCLNPTNFTRYRMICSCLNVDRNTAPVRPHYQQRESFGLQTLLHIDELGRWPTPEDVIKVQERGLHHGRFDTDHLHRRWKRGLHARKASTASSHPPSYYIPFPTKVNL